MSTPRIGFACKKIDFPEQVDGIKPTDDCKKYNTGSTTVAWLGRQTQTVAIEKLWSLMRQNIQAARLLVEYVSGLAPSLRMVRLSSDLLPVYTHPTWSWFWQHADVIAYCEREFGRIGAIAREKDVRLSFHPGQFCCVVSENPGVVERSLEELEYHATMARWMSFGQTKLDFKINVHLSGKLGVAGFDTAWQQMSPELRNCLTLENDEYQAGLDTLLVLKDKVGIVLDIHHHFINTGEYIQPTDARIQGVIESWAGVRPTIHYSQSKSEYLSAFDNCMPTMDQLLLVANKSKLRGHGAFYNHTKLNDWALGHLSWANIQAESKSKNLGSFALHDYWQSTLNNPLGTEQQLELA